MRKGEGDRRTVALELAVVPLVFVIAMQMRELREELRRRP